MGGGKPSRHRHPNRDRSAAAASAPGKRRHRQNAERARAVAEARAMLMRAAMEVAKPQEQSPTAGAQRQQYPNKGWHSEGNPCSHEAAAITVLLEAMTGGGTSGWLPNESCAKSVDVVNACAAA